MLGKIRYLNGGLFLPHLLEADGKYKIAIPDKAFENVLALNFVLETLVRNWSGFLCWRRLFKPPPRRRLTMR